MRAADFPFFDARFLAFAHRGGAAYGPNLHRENTVHAFDTAVTMGYRYLETDVHATVDGVLLAFHDDRLDRVTDSSGQIAQLTWADVARARIGDRDAIPRLADLLERYPEARFNIDAKSDAAVGLLATTIAEHDAYDRVCVSSFSTARLHRLRRELGPRVPSAASARGVAWNRFVPVLARLVNTPAVALQIPVDHAVRGRRVRVLTPGLLRAAHRAGKQVHVWTIDDAQQMTELIDGGVDGIFTDRVDTLRTVLEQRGLWG
jgi:glycerophosphoryl diester phosphodiesterase